MNDITRSPRAGKPRNSAGKFNPSAATKAFDAYRSLRLREAAEPSLRDDPAFQAKATAAHAKFLREFGE